jgi:predicted DCC family thiol-disulfide oxidoreductase YuxK
MSNQRHIIMFDAICNLCSRLVQFIIKKEKKTLFVFLPLQSPEGQSLLIEFGLPTDDIDSVVYVRNDTYYLKSSAILNALKELGGLWKLCYVFIIIPGFFRDYIYKIISRKRYKIFGKQDTCKY